MTYLGLAPSEHSRGKKRKQGDNENGELKQTAVIAAARELAGFIWGVMKGAA
jgi:hypothetical protein